MSIAMIHRRKSDATAVTFGYYKNNKITEKRAFSSLNDDYATEERIFKQKCYEMDFVIELYEANQNGESYEELTLDYPGDETPRIIEIYNGKENIVGGEELIAFSKAFINELFANNVE